MERKLYLALALLSLAMQAVPVFADSACSRRVTFKEPVTIHPETSVVGYFNEGMRAYSFDGNRFRPVPLQIDERNGAGDYVLEGGLPFTANSGNQVLDTFDEMSFDGRDFGQDFSLDQVRKAELYRDNRIWKLRFCSGANLYGFLLLVFDMGLKKQEFASGISFDESSGLVETNFYRYKFLPSNPILLGDVAVAHKGNLVPVFANSWFRIVFKLPWWLPNFSLSDDNFSSSIESWRKGPIRHIVAVGVKLRKFLSIFNFHMFSELVFYERRFEIPTILEFPEAPKEFFRIGSGLLYAVEFPKDAKWDLSSPLLTADSSEFLQHLSSGLASERPYQIALRGPWGRIAMRVRLGGDQGRSLPEPILVYRKHQAVQDKLKDLSWIVEKGLDLGVFTDIRHIEKGTYQFRLDLGLDSEADLDGYDVLDNPSVDWLPII